MMGLLNSKNSLSIFSIWLVTISGMIGIYLGYMDWFVSKTPMNLILGMILLFWNFPPKNGWRSILVWFVVYILGMTVEAVGVKTGLLFGIYEYGENLGFKIIGVPILIGVNWVVLTFLTATVSKRFISNKWLAIFCGAFLMVLLDVFIEPIAPIFDFWSWELGFAPIRNFVDWFIVSLIMQVIVRNELPEESASFPIHHLASQFVFFIFFCLIF
jgi:putative membrane protein